MAIESDKRGARADRAIARGRCCQRPTYDHRFGGPGLGPGQCQFGHCHAGDLMRPEPKKMPALSSAPVAERMRLYRKRRRRGIRCVRVQIHVTEIDALIRKKYLDQQSRDDLKAVEYAIRTVVLDALANEGACR
jgi:hypothetical protein